MMSETFSWWFDRSNLKHEHTPQVLILSLSLVFLTFYYTLLLKSRNKKVPLPPGPRGLPIIGYVPFLDSNLHTCFGKLSQKYGPIFKVQLGSRLCIVLSSASIVEEVHKLHDVVFSNRDTPAMGYAISYGGLDMVWSPYGENWRMLRKICVKDLLSYGRLESLYGLRRREVRNLVNQTFSKNGQPVNIGKCVLVSMFHLLTSMLWGGTLTKEDSNRISLEFGEVVDELSKLVGKPNVSDLFPVLAMFDIQGFEGKMKKYTSYLDRVLEFVIEERLKMTTGENRDSGNEPKDFLQILLHLKDQGEHKTAFTMTHVKAVLLDMLVPGTETSSTTVEWAMSEMMKHPEIMQKARDEIDEIVGINNIVEESHLPKLKYVNAVVKEVMRLHPPAPFLVPRRPSESCTVGGYMIPEGTKIIVNAWAIHRDAACWDNPLEFKPERFLDSGKNYDFNGSSYSFMPFGYGRRVCVGIPMVERTVPYTLASLLHSFNWTLPKGVELDLSETFGIELIKTVPLVLIPEPRLSEPNLYTCN